jgi:hypothetical protein
VIAQTTIEECDGIADERLQAMGMLDDEIKLWVTRCRQLVGVLQVVEVERDNFKAGEGVAKELSKGFKVKIEAEDVESGPTALSIIEAKLAHTKAQLTTAQAQTDDYKARLDASDAQAAIEKRKLTHTEGLLSNSKAELAGLVPIWPPEDESEQVLSSLSPLEIAIKQRDKHRREYISQQARLLEYREDSKQYHSKVADLKAKLKGANAERDSLLRDHTNESSGEAIQSVETYKALRAEIMLANRALQGSEEDHLASHRYYVYKLDQMAGYIEDKMVQSDIDPAPIEGDPPSHGTNTLLDERDVLQFGRGVARRPPRPARGSPAQIRATSLFVLEWTRGIMLRTRMAEIKEWSGKHMIYELRERESIGDKALEEDVACFRTKVGLDDSGHSDGDGDRQDEMEWRRSEIKTKPSRTDGKALPATWARMDQLCKGATRSPSSLPDFQHMRSTAHGHWPEVILAIYSWSFYKIHDSTFDATFESQELLANLYRIWWESGEHFKTHFVCQCCAGTNKKTYTRPDPIACDPFPTPALRLRLETPEPIDLFDSP